MHILRQDGAVLCGASTGAVVSLLDVHHFEHDQLCVRCVSVIEREGDAAATAARMRRPYRVVVHAAGGSICTAVPGIHPSAVLALRIDANSADAAVDLAVLLYPHLVREAFTASPEE